MFGTFTNNAQYFGHPLDPDFQTGQLDIKQLLMAKPPTHNKIVEFRLKREGGGKGNVRGMGECKGDEGPLKKTGS